MSNVSSSNKAATPPVAAPTAKPRTWGPAAAILVVILGFVLSQIIGQIIVSFIPTMFGWDTAKSDAWLRTAPFATFLYVLITETLIIGVLAWFLRHKRSNLKEAASLRKPQPQDLLAAVLGFIAYIVIYAVILTIASSLTSLNTEQEQAVGFAHDVKGIGLVMAAVSLVILPPLVEEVMFRGFLFTTLRRKLSFAWTTAVVSIIFGLMHLFGGGSGSVIIWIAFLDTFVLSLVLCYLRERTGSIWASIGLHMLKNCIVFVNLFIISAR